MNMRTLKSAALAALAILLLPQLVLAQFTTMPLSQCPSQAGLATAIAQCKQPTSISVEALNQQTLMLPLSMPVRIEPTAGRMTMVPLLPTQNMPQDTVMIPMSVPVKIYSTPTSSCISAQLDPSLANAVFMMPCSVGGETFVRPVQLKQQENRMMLLPVNMNDVNGQVNVPIYANGSLMMIPLDCRTTADGITFCPRTAQGQMSVPAQTVLMMDARNAWLDSVGAIYDRVGDGDYGGTTVFHNDGCNVGYLDGHAKWAKVGGLTYSMFYWETQVPTHVDYARGQKAITAPF